MSRSPRLRGRFVKSELRPGGAPAPSQRLPARRGGYCIVMTNEEHLENTIQQPGDDDESFDVYLPVTPTLNRQGATHVARMRGNEVGFAEVLSGFVATGSDLSEPLRSPVDDVALDRIRFALDGLGPARVETIEKL